MNSEFEACRHKGLVMSLEEKTALAEDLNAATALAFLLYWKTTGKQ